MHDGLSDKRMSKRSALNYPTVDNVDDTPPVIDHKGRYWLKIAIFIPVRWVPIGILP